MRSNAARFITSLLPTTCTRTPCVTILQTTRRHALVSPYGTSISEISNNNNNNEAGKTIALRGRLLRSRIKGSKLGFLVLRQGAANTIQIVVSDAHAAALEVAKGITPESVVDVKGTLVAAYKPITSTSCSHYEVLATDIQVVTMAESPLPFTLNDANTRLDTRLDHRVIDMRTPTTNAVLRLTSRVCQYFREYLTHPHRDFIEIHSPKMIASPSEGGSAIFELDYFGQPAYLAQSPQLYKQMALMGDCEKVFEVGPVFRAEKSLTHRHLTEFTGLDVEMIIHHSHAEVLHVLEGTMHSILHRLQAECRDLVAAVTDKKDEITILMTRERMDMLGVGEDNADIIRDATHSSMSSAPLSATTKSTDRYGARVGAKDSDVPILRLPFDGAVQLLMDNKIIDAFVDDFNLQQEKQLGELIKERYGVDVYVIDLFYKSARPFYTMLDPNNSDKTLSYDMYLRGEEICSGAQRIHNPSVLQIRADECGVSQHLIKDYIDSFRYGAYPHGGFGLGLERIVLFFLGLSDVRQVSMFPRDPRRIKP